MGILDIADEYDRMEQKYFAKSYTEAEENLIDAYVIAQHNHVPAKLPIQVPYRHLVSIVQMASNYKEVLEILSRNVDFTGATDEELKRLWRRCECVRYWLDGFAPDNVKFSVLNTIPDTLDLSMNEKVFFQALVRRMNDCNWTADEITASSPTSPRRARSAPRARTRRSTGSSSGRLSGPGSGSSSPTWTRSSSSTGWSRPASETIRGGHPPF